MFHLTCVLKSWPWAQGVGLALRPGLSLLASPGITGSDVMMAEMRPLCAEGSVRTVLKPSGHINNETVRPTEVTHS